MNYVDLIILIVILFFAREGQKRGFLVQLFDILGFLAALIGSLTFYQYVSQALTTLLNVPQIAADPIAFLLVWLLTEFIFFNIFATLFRKVFSSQADKPVNRYLGFIPATLNALLFVAFVLLFVVSLPISTQIKKDIFAAKIAPVLIDNATAIEKPFNNIFGPITKRSFTFFTVSPDEKECQPLGFTTNNVSVDYKSEQTMFNLVNQERQKAGTKPLVWNEQMAQVARNHSTDMFARNYFCHYSPEGKDVGDRLAAANIDYAAAGENLAYAPDVTRAHNGLMNSPGHKRNILDPAFTKVGIGAIDGGVYGKIFTQVFTN
ncbi:MAG TPA: CvpA family protein [Candidatus Saccharimonadales bacterium]|nr:CvpA family protein [Candidatus Saccharimonadales bacterium]